MMWSEAQFRVNNLIEALKEAGAIYPFSSCVSSSLVLVCFSPSDSALAINMLTGHDIEISQSKLLGTDFF